jgi:hypothetical protein
MPSRRKRGSTIPATRLGKQVDLEPRLPQIPTGGLNSVALRSRLGNLTRPVVLSVHISVEEKVSAMIKRDGGVGSVEVKGDMMLRVSDPNKARIKVAISGALEDENVQFKVILCFVFALARRAHASSTYQTHPNVDKQLFTSDNVLALKDSGKPFPVNQSLGILRWRYSSKEAGAVPLSSEFLV